MTCAPQKGRFAARVRNFRAPLSMPQQTNSGSVERQERKLDSEGLLAVCCVAKMELKVKCRSQRGGHLFFGCVAPTP